MIKLITQTWMLLMKLLITTLLILFAVNAQSKPLPKPAIQQATVYKTVTDINQYWLSEKLDGMRGYWNGTHLLTRQGNLIHSPKWFTKNWPDKAMDGELWVKRDYFQQTLSCIRKKIIDETCWKFVRFMIFDLPENKETFTKRIIAMQQLTKKANSLYLSIIEQFKLTTVEQLHERLNKIVKNNGEGLMLHLGIAYYHVGRTASIMKLKKHHDAEAVVMAHIEGKGKYQGLLGAIQVKTSEGVIFKIGSGFTDQDRHKPPEIGSLITFKYNGKTQAGIPRFARYYRIREKRTSLLADK
ncbi:DNA ligase [Candidatus Colwellia aromaticivorans]|uniref:DNA ligase n=1 Tax=Candidatus Colwellia aromaticivorans TaxID=2267621 RepID=UPI000DF44F78|nr:DNA ligase [Candidatus Colwellia aromaticivorans]